ncbi:hypothetical protein Fmac_015907 [Flemingia macrophylla]|uniref:Uncharacterized protein n=1 Tax=Flemingia macrophylla TaxID=520843 RepID=A0ABD1MFV9_9FABA
MGLVGKASENIMSAIAITTKDYTPRYIALSYQEKDRTWMRQRYKIYSKKNLPSFEVP